MKTWGKYIQKMRRTYRIKQKQLADYACISERHLRDLENGVIPEPELDERYEIEHALKQLIKDAPPVAPTAAGCRIWGRTLRRKRRAYGVTQQWFALQLGVTVKYLRGLESGEIAVSYDRQDEIMDAIERFNPETEPLSIIIDYVRIRFKTTDVRRVIENVLWMKMAYFAQEDHGFYHYTGMYYHGDICVLTSSDESLGVLLELKGKGCRQFECCLKGQERNWFEFFRCCMMKDCVFKRLDLAVNDKAGLLHIPTLAEKCDRGELLSVFRHTEAVKSGDMRNSREENKAIMGHTLYIGSRNSDIYFCIYEKAQEQLAKYGTPLIDTETRNRFEIRLKDDRAFLAAYDLVSNENPAETIFSIIDNYVCFVDRDDAKPKQDWPVNKEWERFIGGQAREIKLTMQPEPFDLTKTENWLAGMVAKMMKTVQIVEKGKGNDFIGDLLEHTELNDKHKRIIKQMSAQVEDIIKGN